MIDLSKRFVRIDRSLCEYIENFHLQVRLHTKVFRQIGSELANHSCLRGVKRDRFVETLNFKLNEKLAHINRRFNENILIMSICLVYNP